MVTVRELHEDDARREQSEQERIKQASEEYLRQQMHRERRDLQWAKQALDTELGEFLLKQHRNGIRKVRLERYHSWYPAKHPEFTSDGWDEFYGNDGCKLPLDPRPAAEATLELLRRLREAGFTAAVVARMEDRGYCETTADGQGDFVPTGGCDAIWGIEISWD